jgi:hypothetical protein
MPELEDAKLSGVPAKGYIEVSTERGVKAYNGVVEMERDRLTELATREEPLEFEGVTEDDLHRYRIVLPVRITRFDTPTRAFIEGLSGPSRLDPLDLENVEEE